MFPTILGSVKVVQIDSININRQFAGYEPPVVVSKSNKTITINLSSAGKEVFLYLAAFYLPDFKTQLISLAEEVGKKSLEEEAIHAKHLAEEKHKAKVEAVRIKMAAEAAAFAEEAEIRKEIAAEGKRRKG